MAFASIVSMAEPSSLFDRRRSNFRGLDTLVIDLQDIGSRYYTFQATMLYCLQAAADNGVAVVVLDQPIRSAARWWKDPHCERASRVSLVHIRLPRGMASQWANSRVSIAPNSA